MTPAAGPEQAFLLEEFKGIPGVSSVLHGCDGMCVWGPEQLVTWIYLRAAKGRGELAFLISFCRLV